MPLVDLLNKTKPYEFNNSASNILGGGSRDAAGIEKWKSHGMGEYFIQYVDGNRRTKVELYYENGCLNAVAYETVSWQTKKPSRRTGHLQSWKLKRRADARVEFPSPEAVEDFIDATRQLAGMLRGAYWEKYKANFNAPLEDLLISSGFTQPVYLQ